ncbi:MAG: hypothetical protein PHN98_02960 [Smithellaceae bacterium]|nr:hypothetical protein [Smithellaceae bacterium]
MRQTHPSSNNWETLKEADQEKQRGFHGGTPVFSLGIEQYIINKRATGRKKDFGDLEIIDE